MLEYIIEVYFLRKVSSAVILLQGHLRTLAAFLEMTISSEGPPLYKEHLPMNRLFLTTATPSQ